jgi:hypothetical protein
MLMTLAVLTAVFAIEVYWLAHNPGAEPQTIR